MSLAIPPNDLGSRETIKKIEGRVWHPQERTWLVPMSQPNYEKLKAAFGEALQPPNEQMIREILPPVYPNAPKMTVKPNHKTIENKAAFDSLNAKQQLAVTKLEHLLIEERKEDSTITGYRNFFINFLLFYKDVIPSLITNEQIRAYIVKRIKEENISKSTQNTMISTFKAFYGRLLNQYDKVNDLYRPHKPPPQTKFTHDSLFSKESFIFKSISLKKAFCSCKRLFLASNKGKKMETRCFWAWK